MNHKLVLLKVVLHVNCFEWVNQSFVLLIQTFFYCSIRTKTEKRSASVEEARIYKIMMMNIRT
jgi:hypothetical protein